MQSCRLPVSLEMMEEYEAFCKAFRRSVHENHDQGSLDLGRLQHHSTSCSAPCHLSFLPNLLQVACLMLPITMGSAVANSVLVVASGTYIVICYYNLELCCALQMALARDHH